MAKKIQLPFHIVLLGQITAGKDTQAQLLKQHYNFKLVQSGLFTRKVLKEKTQRGDDFRRSAGKGQPAPMKYMKEFFLQEIEKCPKNGKLLFLGGPRLKPEAQLLYKLLMERGDTVVAFYISLPDKEIHKRSLHRNQSDVEAIYKVLDQDKKIIANRIKYHKDQVGKTVAYFATKPFFAKINGNQSIEKVHLDIQKHLYAFLKKM